jgi:type IV pilus assembly protein PilC
VGNLIRKINVERFARTLGNLTAAGIPLIDALGITADTADNEVVRRTLLKVRDTVEKGGKMDEPMRSAPIFDELVVDMVMVGDEAGALDTLLLKIADTYDSEVDLALKGLSSILEPLLIVLLGLAVGFLAVAVFLPYVSLVRNPALMPE